jgi:hypothetical protein
MYKYLPVLLASENAGETREERRRLGKPMVWFSKLSRSYKHFGQHRLAGYLP